MPDPVYELEIDPAKLATLLLWLAPQWTPEQRRQTAESLASSRVVLPG